MREARHFHTLTLSVGTLGQCNSQYFRSNNSIFGIGFIEISTPEKHNRIGMLCLQLKKLLHHRG